MPERLSLFRTWTGQSQKSHKSHKTQPDQSPLDVPSVPQTGLHLTASNVSSTTDPYAGHLNHLSEFQDAQLNKFKSSLLEQGLYQPASLGQAASHDDQSLLRYLRARKFEVQGALAQFADTDKWSRENKIPMLYETIDVDFYEKARRLYPQWTGHRDRRGIPVYVYMVKYLDSKNVNSYSSDATAYKAKLPFHSTLGTPAKMLPLFALYENMIRFVLPLCTSIESRPHPEVPVTNSNNIVDISGVGLKQFWNLKSHMQESSVLATSHYPETLDRIFIIGAPSFFPTVWSWIKRWFDPVTVNKIFIIPQNEVKARLSEYIDPDDFPKLYGGNLDWEFGMTPHLDDAARQAVEKNGTKGWMEGPCLWQYNQRVPVGTKNGHSRRPADLVPMGPPLASQHISHRSQDTTIPAPAPIHAASTTNGVTAASNTIIPPSTSAPAPAPVPIFPTTNGISTVSNPTSTRPETDSSPSSKPSKGAAVAAGAVVAAAAAAAAAASSSSSSHHQNGHSETHTNVNTNMNMNTTAPAIIVTNGDTSRSPSPALSVSSLASSIRQNQDENREGKKEKPAMQRFVTAVEDLKVGGIGGSFGAGGAGGGVVKPMVNGVS